MPKCIIVILTLLCHTLADQGRTCNVTELTTNYHVRHVRSSDDDIVEHSTSLTLRCKHNDQFTWAYCLDGSWTYGDDNSCSTYVGKALKRPKRGWFRVRIRFRFRRVTRVIGRFVCSLFSCPGRRPRDQTPPEIRGCPTDKIVYAIPIQRHTFVDWIQPTAWDNRDGQIGVHLSSRKEPGSPFFERDDGRPTLVGYWAKDSSGNMATCNFNILVKVKRCPVRPNFIRDGYRVCHLSSDMRLGTVCRYGCYQGHTLKGAPSIIECVDAGGSQARWSSDVEPYCEKKQCTEIIERGQLKFLCSENFFFRSICNFDCGDGYDIPLNQRRTKVCLASGTWNGDDPDCIDIEPPVIEKCPGSLIFYPEDNKDTAVVYWETPSVKDNKDIGLEAIQLSGPYQASKMKVNSYLVKYGSSDAAGNKAEECEFEVIVKQLRCPRLYPLPYMEFNCSGTRRGAECSFACEDNSQLVGKRSTYCRRNADVPYAEWIMDFHPYCELSNGCPDLSPPENGALSYDVWLGGRFCHPLCSEGYSVGYSLPNIMICQENGVWTDKDKLSDCFETTNSRRRYVTMSAEFYFSGDCNDPDTQMQIKQKFIEAVTNSDSFIVKKNCQSPECNVGNVKVICSLANRKRSTSNMVVETEIYFEHTNGSLTSHQYETEVSTFTEFMSSLQNEFTASNFTLNIGDGQSFLTEMTANDLELDCPENSVPVFSDIVACVKCPIGMYYEGLSKTCNKCPRGSYQPLIAQSDCIPCPFMRTTGRIGATDSAECEDACLPGTWSMNGLPPCVECDIAYYESNYGSTRCSQCPGDTITLHEKSDNVSYCMDYDIVFPSGLETSTHMQLDSVNLSAPFVVLFHVKCKNDCKGYLFKLETPLKIIMEMTFDIFCLNEQSSVVDFDVKNLSKKWRHIEIHVSFEKSDLYIDNVLHKTFDMSLDLNYTSKVNVSLGGNGFVGAISQFMVVSKSSFNSNKQSFKSCNSVIRPTSLINWNEFAYSNLLNAYISIPSNCDDFDNCHVSHCIHGNCTDKLGDYSCVCEQGFNGKNCDANIDDCIAHACQNNATCVDEVRNYSCACEYGFKGELCEIAMVDGGWSEWENWTECSVSCGNGTIQRKRACADPLPDNGGQFCIGSDTDVEDCSMEPCKECEDLVEPPNSTLACETNMDMTGCVLECHDGFDFDHDARQNMYCGNETYHQWDFQADSNPYRRLPYCIETIPSSGMHVHHAAFYVVTECDEQTSKDVINKIHFIIESVIQQLTCYTSNICSLKENRVLNCNKTRIKRDTSGNKVGFNVTLTCNPGNLGTDTCFRGLEDAIEELETLESGNQLDFTHNSKVYKIIQNSTQSDAELDCPIGTVPYIAYCVPCSYGHYNLNDDCLSCPMGTYQDEIGQVFCHHCPEGWTTEGTDSVSKEDCNEPAPIKTKDEKKFWVMIAVVVTIPVIFVITVVIVAYCRHTRSKQKGKKLLDTTRHDNDKIVTVNNRCFLDEDDLDTIQLRVNSPPPVNWSFSVNSITRQKTFDQHKQALPKRDCWSSMT